MLRNIEQNDTFSFLIDPIRCVLIDYLGFTDTPSSIVLSG